MHPVHSPTDSLPPSQSSRGSGGRNCSGSTWKQVCRRERMSVKAKLSARPSSAPTASQAVCAGKTNKSSSIVLRTQPVVLAHRRLVFGRIGRKVSIPDA
eukprot:768539-Hanusia_phi.AAC.8